MASHTNPTEEAWQDLAEPTPAVGRFDPADVADLPAPARRLLTASLEPGAALSPVVVLDMRGRIRLGRWLPFRARQVLRAGTGMVWQARVGFGPLAVRGADTFHRGRGRLDFRLFGLVPVARAHGTDVDRSTIGRLAAETVVWAPQALVPAMGAEWHPVDDHHAVVTLPVDRERVPVTVTVDDDGHLRALDLLRWGDPDGGVFAWHAFGGDVTGHGAFDGVTIATAGRVGWHRDRPDRADGEFFEYLVTDAAFPHLSPPAGRTPDRGRRGTSDRSRRGRHALGSGSHRAVGRPTRRGPRRGRRARSAVATALAPGSRT